MCVHTTKERWIILLHEKNQWGHIQKWHGLQGKNNFVKHGCAMSNWPFHPCPFLCLWFHLSGLFRHPVNSIISIRHSMAGICNSSPLQGVAGKAFSLYHHFVPLWQETIVCTLKNVLTNWITSNCQSQTSIIFDPYTNEIVCLLASTCEVPVAFCQLRAMLYMCKFTVLRPCRVSQDHDKVAPYPEKPWKGAVKRFVHTGSRMFQVHV